MREKKAIAQLVGVIGSFKESGDIITDQINTGNLKQNFISYLLDYIYKLEKLDDTLKNLKSDIERIMQKILEEAKETLEKVYPFLKIIQNDLDPAEKAVMDKNATDLKAFHASIVLALRTDAWPKYTLDEANDIISHGRDLIRILRQDVTEAVAKSVAEAREEHFAE